MSTRETRRADRETRRIRQYDDAQRDARADLALDAALYGVALMRDALANLGHECGSALSSVAIGAARDARTHAAEHLLAVDRGWLRRRASAPPLPESLREVP